MPEPPRPPRPPGRLIPGILPPRPPGTPAPTGKPPAPPPEALTVAQLTDSLRRLVEPAFANVTVQGEISNFKRQASSGHLYLSLKDNLAQVKAVMFRGDARYLRFEPADGQVVLARGSIGLFPSRGEYQLAIRFMEPRGLGGLQAALEKLKEKLAADGLFEASRKRRLPLLPRRIGIVTSPSGAAIRDILRVLERRFYHLGVLIYPARVQGEGASIEIAEGIDVLNRREDLDVIIVGRGGGSIEDLWPFNEEPVARAIARSRLPVISAVGHEVDVTIADLVADLRAPTPSAAAEMVVACREEIERRLSDLGRRLAAGARAAVSGRRHAVARLTSHRGLDRPRSALGLRRQRLDEISSRLLERVARRAGDRRSRLRAAAARLALVDPRRTLLLRRTRTAALHQRLVRLSGGALPPRRAALAALARSLEHLSPLAVLERGYAIARTTGGAVVRDPAEVRAGQRLRLLLHRGTLDVRAAGGNAPRDDEPGRQPSLFGEDE